MKKVTIFLLTLLLTTMFSFAQQCPTNTSLVQPWTWPAHSNWYFGDGNIHNFNTGVTTNSNAYDSYEGISSVSDDQGNLLFYTNGRNLWDADGNLTSNALLEGNEGGGTGPVGSASQGVITIRHPFAPDDYYVLTTDDALGATLGLNYVIVGKDGQVKSGPTRLGGFRTTEGIAATLHDNGLDVWVTVQVSGTRDYYTYLLTCSGFESGPVISNVGPPGVVADKERGGIAFSPDGSKFVQGHPDYWPNSGKEVTIYDFDNLTGYITNPIDIASTQTSQNPYDITFSPDGQMVYFTQAGTGTIWSIDVSSGVKATMVASLTNTGLGGGGFSAIEIGPDGQIYTGGGSATSMGGNNLGTADFGLPTMYIPPADSVEIQPVGNIQICDLPLDLSTLWYCKGSDAENTSRYENAYSMELSAGQHTLDDVTGFFNTSSVGQYRVRFQICDIWDTLTFNIEDCETCEVKLKQEAEVCLGETLFLNNLFDEMSYGGYWTIDSLPSSNPDGDNYVLAIQGIDTILFKLSDAGTYKLSYNINKQGLICKDSIYVTVRELPKPDVLSDASFCPFKGSHTLDVSSFDNGNGPYTYNWINNTNESSMRTLPLHNQGFPGYYWVDITDKYGCVGRDSVLLSISFNLTPVIVGSPLIEICEGDSVTLVSNYIDDNIYYFNWSTGENTESIVVKESGDYDVFVYDRYECEGTATVEVVVNPLPIVSDGNYSICEGDKIILGDNLDDNSGQILLSPINNYYYLWENSGEVTYSLEVGETGDYKRIVTTNKGCVDSSVYSLVVNDLPNVNLGNDTSICIGEDIVFDAGEGFDYEWSPNGSDRTITVDSAYVYSVIITDMNNCKDTDSVSLLINDLPIVDLGNDTSICIGEDIVFDAGSGYVKYKWSENEIEQTILVNSPNLYSVIVTDSNGCEKTDDIELSLDTLPIVDLGNDTSICDGFDITFDAGYGYLKYQWSPNGSDRTITVDSSFQYSVIATDSNGCIGSDSVVLTIDTLPIVNLGNDTSICEDVDITFDAIVGSEWLWSNGVEDKTIKVNSTSVYDVKVTDDLGCVGYDTIVLTIDTLPIFDLGPDTSICSYETIELNTKIIQATHLWSTGGVSNSIVVNTPGDYSVLVTNSFNCSSSDDIVLYVNESPNVDIGEDIKVCVGTPVNISSQEFNGYSYDWSSGETTNSINPTVGGDYELKVTSLNGCIGFDTVVVEILSNPVLDLGDDITICDGGVAILESNSQHTTTWSNGSVGDTIMVTDNGSFTAIISNGFCSDTDTILVDVIDYPVSGLDKSIEDQLICFGDDQDGLNLESGGNGRYDYLWSTGETTSDIYVYSGGLYKVTISEEFCSISDSVFIKEYCSPSLYIPNAFTPNDDDKNNTFFAKSRNIIGFNILIFDRWGMLIFESDNVFQHWDGTFKGRPVQEDVYVWKICYSYYNIGGSLVEKNRVGTVTVIR